MDQPASPCRLFVYLAREAPIGAVLRRGPSAWVRLSVWHTDTDTVEHGQWFKGRVYERRADVSADGALFVYFASKSDGRPPADSWIAISRPPYFTALALWFYGCGTWCSGGFFPGRRALWLGAGPTPPDVGRLPPGLTLSTAAPPYIDRASEWTERTVFINIAQHGRLFHWQPPGTLRELADFNPQAPDPAPAPGWAQTWPQTWTRRTPQQR